MKTISKHRGRLARRAGEIGSGLLGGLLLWLGGASLVAAGSTVISSVTPREVPYVLDYDQGTARDYHLIKGSVTVLCTGASGADTLRVQIIVLDENDDALPAVAGSNLTASWTSPVLAEGDSEYHSFDFAFDPDDKMETDRVYRVRAQLQERVLVGGRPLWMIRSSKDSTARHYYHFMNTAGTDAAWNAQAQIESVSFSRDWRVQTSTNSAYRQFRVATSTRFLRFDEMAAANPTQNTLTFQFRMSLKDDLGNSQPLTVPGPDGHASTLSMATWQAGKLPTDSTETLYHYLQPQGQLDPVNRLYALTVEVWSAPAPGVAPVRLSQRTTALTRLLDFNGSLGFGSSFTATMLAATRTAPEPVFDTNHMGVEMNLAVVSKSSGDATYSGNLGIQTLRLWSTGVATYTSATVVTLTNEAGPTTWPRLDASGISYKLGPVLNLDSSGARTQVLIDPLPAGMGVSENNTPPTGISPWLGWGALLSKLPEVANVSLNAAMAPVNAVVWNYPAGVWVTEECKPVAVRSTAITWVDGRFELTTDGQMNHPETVMRQQLAAAPVAIPVEYRTRRSNNDAWLLATTVKTSPKPFIRGAPPASSDPGSNAVATMDFTLGAGSFKSHFPEATITTTAVTGNRISISADMISPGVSFLDGASIQINYLRTDPDSPVPPASSHSVTLQPAGASARLNFTPTGGLRATCATGHTLIWGRLNDGRYAFATDPFQSTVFFMPGSFYPQGMLNTGQNELSHQKCPVNIHLAGQVASNWRFEDMERPGTTAYQTNSLRADYAGVNLRVQGQAAGFQGRSIICGTAAAAYPLTAESRYYVRKAGVTGIHDAIGGPSGVSLFGFAATLTSYGLSFTDSRVTHSVTDAELIVPYPSQYTLPIQELGFSASGTPSGGTPAVTGPLTLAYWQTKVVPLGLEFQRTSDTDPAAGVMAMETAVSLPSLGQSVLVYGKLGFQSNGRLIRASDNLLGITSRLRPPNQIVFNGPTKPGGFEKYRLTPVADIYLNHYEGPAAPVPGYQPGDGFLNIAGLLDVAFFQDLQVHLQASANSETQAEVAVLHLTGGWTTGSGASKKSFFTDTGFDPENLGRPAGVPLATYRTGAAYMPRALRTWMDTVDFDYPLVWDDVTRIFNTPDSFNGEVDLLVLEAHHQLESLSAEQASLRFGASYDGIPQISVGNLLVNAVDDATGALSALEKAMKKPVGTALWAASDAAAGLLNDNLDVLIGPVIEDALHNAIQAQVIDPLGYPDNHTGPPPKPGWLKPETDWDQNLTALTTTTGWACKELVKLGSLPGSVNAQLTATVRGNIDDMIDGLDVFIGAGGLLEVDGNGNYRYGAALVYSLIDDIASDDIKNLLHIRPGSPAEEWVARQTTGLINKYVPALNAVRARMEQIKTRLEEIRGLFDPNAMLAKVITERFNALPVAWTGANGLGAVLAADLKEHLRNKYGGNPQAFALEANREETARFLIRRIRDRIATAAIATQLQTLLRQQLQDIQNLIDQTVDSVFSNFKRIIRDLVAEVTGGLDATISEFTGQLNSVVKAASVEGHAVIHGDTLSHLRLDAALSLTLDEPIEFKGYIEINQLPGNSSYGNAREIRIGALGVPIEIMNSSADFDVEARIVLNEHNSPLGLGGKFEMKSGGVLSFEGFKITEMSASVMFGTGENYLAAKLGMEFESFRITGALFVGHSQTLAPLLLVDKDVASVIREGPITGIYIYGELYMPIVNLGCFFKVSAGLGLGAFYFTEGPTYGGKIKANVDGEALCVVSVSGEVMLVGAKSDIMRFKGRGKIGGKIGWCPFCIKFSKQVEFTYDDNNGFDANF